MWATSSHCPLRREQGWLGCRCWGQTFEDAHCSHPSPLFLMYIHTCCSLHSLHHDQSSQLMHPRHLEALAHGQNEHQGCCAGQLPPSKARKLKAAAVGDTSRQQAWGWHSRLAVRGVPVRTGSLVQLLVEPKPRSTAPSPEKVMALPLWCLHKPGNTGLSWQGAYLWAPG